MTANCASCAGDWAFDPTKPRKEHKDCDWLHGAGGGADVPLNDSATAYLASCDALRTESDAGVLTCLLTRDDVLRPTRSFGDGCMLPLARALRRPAARGDCTRGPGAHEPTGRAYPQPEPEPEPGCNA